MSTPERTHARMLTVDRETADVLRLQAKTVMDLGHELFEDFLDYGPEAQYILAMRFCAATALITAVGWDPTRVDPNTTTYEIPLTDDLVEQLHHRRRDLRFTNVDRLDNVSVHEPIPPDILAEVIADRRAGEVLDHLFGAYARAVRAT